MKHNLLFLSMLFMQTISCESKNFITLPKVEDYKPLPPGTNLNIFNNNTQSVHVTETRREVQTHITQPPVIINPIPPVLPTEPPYFLLNKSIKQGKGYINNCTAWVKDWKNNILSLKTGAFVVGIFALTYGVLWTKFLKHSYNAKKNNTWGALQEHVPPHLLSSLPSLKLAQGLIEEIKKKYPPTNPTNLMPSLLAFNKDVDKELEELTAFLAFHEWLDFFKLSIAFPNQKRLITRAKLKIQRLNIFKDAMEQWTNTHSARLIQNKAIPCAQDEQLDLEIETNYESDVTVLPSYEL